MLSNQIRAVFAGRFCLGEERKREKSNERRVNRVDTFSRDEERERFRVEGGKFEIREESFG